MARRSGVDAVEDAGQGVADGAGHGGGKGSGEGAGDGGGVVDLHSHLMPAVDDGARDPDEAAAAAEELVAAGVTAAVATPHMPASATRGEPFARYMEAFDTGWERLRRACRQRASGLRLERGVELRLNEPEPDLSDPRLRLGGETSVLVEFDRFQIPPYGGRQLSALAEEGWRPVLAHPERYMGIRRRMEDAVPSWREAGAVLLLNAGSLLGAHGPGAREAAGEFLRRGWADALASDYHTRGELPWPVALEALEESGGEEQVELLTRSNPRRILEGRPTLPVPPLKGGSSVWSRLRRWLG